MSTQIQFGDNWVKVNESVFYLTPSAVKAVKTFYERVKADIPDAEVDVEYLAKAFVLLRPQNDVEAEKFMSFLNENYPEMKEIVDRIYENRSGVLGVSQVREL
ncbi:hypothetical protein EWF20_03270 [Sulfolobus sp. S-194]|uniref:hypothetical protein n=1 Tax=Sulfolobus sp. S-194 TaxID=2512240 RepID=UPI001436D199|nr:hypothetical protein [Sulfolobus sp. S-194]QIW23258.1 hypothetical protein EWF20_03270 [Sulfolobus sp. S-194]